MTYLTVAQVAELAQVADKTVRRAISGGRLPASRVDGVSLIRIREEDAVAWIEGTPVRPPALPEHRPRRRAGHSSSPRGSFADLMEIDRKAATP